jgi:hypothetical protein
VRFTTYTFTDMRGNGKSLNGVVRGEGSQTRWFFVYFGYRKSLKKAVGIYWTHKSVGDFSFTGVQHFTTAKFQVKVATFDGYYARVVVNLGKGAFLER